MADASDSLHGPAGDRERLEEFHRRIAAVLASYLWADMVDLAQRAGVLLKGQRPDRKARAVMLRQKWSAIRDRRNQILVATGLPTVDQSGCLHLAHETPYIPFPADRTMPIMEEDVGPVTEQEGA